MADMRWIFVIVLNVIFLNSCINISINNINKSIISPDGKYVAISFIRSAGATTGFSPQVSIVPNGKKLPNRGGNIFIGDHSKYIDLYWKDDNTLVVYHDCIESDIFKKISAFKNIKIEYVQNLNKME
jgi:hypothetical protein